MTTEEQAKLGRPTRGKTAATRFISIRFTEEELRVVKRRAGKTPVTVYLRQLALGVKP